MVYIKKVTPVDHYCLEAILENESSVTLNLEDMLQQAQDAAVRDAGGQGTV